MILNDSRGLLPAILVVFGFSCFAQTEKLPLRDVLSQLETRYDVSFSYRDEDIVNVVIEPPDASLSRDKALRYLEKRTQLKFQLLSERYIAVVKAAIVQDSYCGTVVDVSGELLAGAIVKSENQFVLADANGRFELKGLQPHSTISISFFGFEQRVLFASQLGSKECQQVQLSYAITELKELVVSEFITEGISKKADGSFVVHTEQIKILPGLVEPDVLKGLQVIPGILSVDETVSNLNVRGGTNDQNLVLWDGIRMYQAGHFFGLISVFNPYIIKRATLVKNGSSSDLTDGVSSTIILDTSDDRPQNVNGSIGVNMLNADGYINLPLGKKSFAQISGRRSLADVAETPTYRQYFSRAFRQSDITEDLFNPDSSRVTSNEKFSFSDITAKVVTDFNKQNRMKLSFINVMNEVHYDENAVLNNQPRVRTSSLNQNSIGAGLTLSQKWSEKFRTSVHYNLSSYSLASVNFDVLNDRRVEQENKVLETSLKLESKLQVSDNVVLHQGYHYTETGVSDYQNVNVPRFEQLTKRVLRKHAVFSEAGFSFWNDKGEMRAGVRLDYIPKLEKLLMGPRLALRVGLTESWSLQLLGEMKNQTVSQVIDFQTDFLGVEKRKWVLSNGADIPVATSQQVSVGAQYERSSLLIGIEGYVKSVSGITSASQGFLNQFEFRREEGSYTSRGGDFIISKRNDKRSAWIGYSLLVNEYHFPLFLPPRFTGNLDVRHSITAGFNLAWKKFQFSAGASWHTGAPFTEPESVAVNILYASPNSSRISNYFRTDVSAKYFFTLGKTRFMVGVAAWNMLNRQNINGYYYKLNAAGQPERISQQALGFTPNAVLRIDF